MGAQAALGGRDATPELIRETLGLPGQTALLAAFERRTSQAGHVTGRVRFLHTALRDALCHIVRCHLDHADVDRTR